MFGLSLGKIVLTILVIVAVWRAWKWLAPLIARLQAPDEPEAAAKGREQRPEPRAVELVECPHCGTFVPKGTFCGSRESCLIRRG
jgi:hypothetical protein